MTTTSIHGSRSNGNANGNQKKKQASNEPKPFHPNYDYEVDYNDHFETPLNAYTDVLPLLDSLAQPKTQAQRKSAESGGPPGKKNDQAQHLRKEHILYDPYYCNGRTKGLLMNLGFDKVIHEKRDFYKDIREGKVPKHHTLVTNPPYSDDHKEKCLEFCTKQFREKKIAFFLLIPNYVAARSYYRRILGETIHDVAYLVPHSEYSYSHPEGTGHEKSPFSSLWFCCIGRDRIQEWTQQKQQQEFPDDDDCYDYYRKNKTDNRKQRPQFVASFDELVSLGVISLQTRPNPKQRKKMRKLAAQSLDKSAIKGSNTDRPQTAQSKIKKTTNAKEQVKGKKRSNAKSKYRSTDGKRTKKRF